MTMPERGSLDPTALALPPLTASELWVHEDPMTGEMRESAASYTKYSVEARERILVSHADDLQRQLTAALARIAELESLWQSAEACYAEADAAAMAHAKRIAELEADAARLDSGRIMFTTRDVYGEPARVTFAGVDLRAAIDAAREAKP